jgi:hypothetical protein
MVIQNGRNLSVASLVFRAKNEAAGGGEEGGGDKRSTRYKISYNIQT